MSAMATLVGLPIRSIHMTNGYLQFAIHISLYLLVFSLAMFMISDEDEKQHLKAFVRLKH